MGQLKLKKTNFKIGTNLKIDTKKIESNGLFRFYQFSFAYNLYALPFFVPNHILKIEKIHFEKGFKNLPIFEIPVF